jgi:hypothetical protein
MFGHGQIEGFAEKYGMEYRRAYWDELPDPHLVERHEREIFPLLHRRHLFSEVRDFVLYDFWSTEGHVNEDVFAYSNRWGDERALVVYHNKFAEARGWIKDSVGFAVKGPDGSKWIEQHTLGAGLKLHRDESRFTIFRDSLTGLEYIRGNQELCDRGFYVELAAYKCHVFLDFRQVVDNEWHHYEYISTYLNGRGVPSIETALLEILLQPIHRPFMELVNADLFRRLMEERVTKAVTKPDSALLDEAEGKSRELLRATKEFTGGQEDEAAVAREMRERLGTTLRLPVLMDGDMGAYIRSNLDDKPGTWGVLFGWLSVHMLGKVVTGIGFEEHSRIWLDEWQLSRILAGVLQDFGLDERAADYGVTLVKLLTTHQHWFENGRTDRMHTIISSLLRDNDVQRALQVNRYQGILWFNKEAFEQLLWWMFVITSIACCAARPKPPEKEILPCWETIRKLRQASEASEYQVEKLLEGTREPKVR